VFRVQLHMQDSGVFSVQLHRIQVYSVFSYTKGQDLTIGILENPDLTYWVP